MSNQILEGKTSSRRELLGKGVLALGTVAALPLLSHSASAQQTPAPAAPAPQAATLSAGDLEIVRFALTLERMEAAFYAQVLGAQTTRAYLPTRLLEHTRALAAAEAAHVSTLEGVLTSVGQTVPAAQNFKFPGNVFVSPIAFAWFGYTLEEIGIGAYLGAAPKIEAASLKKAAVSIFGAESRHAAILRSFAGYNFAPHYFESPLSTEQVTSLITPYLA